MATPTPPNADGSSAQQRKFDAEPPVIIDTDKREARWVTDAASRYQFIPASSDLLVDIVTGASTADLYRAPIPKRQP